MTTPSSPFATLSVSELASRCNPAMTSSSNQKFWRNRPMKRAHLIALTLCSLLFVVASARAQKHEQVYTRVNLVSDIDGVARFTDPHLVNPWGLAFSANSPFWIADNNGNVSTLYNGRGQAFPVGSPLVVNIPAPGAPTAAPRLAWCLTEPGNSASPRMASPVRRSSCLAPKTAPSSAGHLQLTSPTP